VDDGAIETIKQGLKLCVSDSHKLVLARLLSLLAKVIQIPGAALSVIEHQDIIVRLFLYLNSSFPDLCQDCIRSLHAIFKLGTQGLQKLIEFKINLEAFATQASLMIESSAQENNTVLFVNNTR